MFNFATPGTGAFQMAVRQARLVNDARAEPRSAAQTGMVDFLDATQLKMAFDERMAAIGEARRVEDVRLACISKE